MRIEIKQNVDETGEIEELSWDLFPLVDASETTHLDGSGLPKVGTRIKPGMIVVGKIAKTRLYDPEHQPNAQEIHGLDLKTLRSKYGHMWTDNSLYADGSLEGTVTGASLEQRDGRAVAIVEIEKETSPPTG